MIKLYYTPKSQSFHLTMRTVSDQEAADSGMILIYAFAEDLLKAGNTRALLGCLSVLRSRSVQEIREAVAIFIKRYGN